MSLRGYNERVCNIGNVFSGLSCILDNKPSPVHTVRKPAGAITDTTRRRTWRDSKALDLRKKALAPALRRLRPHELQPEDTRGTETQGELSTPAGPRRFGYLCVLPPPPSLHVEGSQNTDDTTCSYTIVKPDVASNAWEKWRRVDIKRACATEIWP